jgi:hypothetical protein
VADASHKKFISVTDYNRKKSQTGSAETTTPPGAAVVHSTTTTTDDSSVLEKVVDLCKQLETAGDEEEAIPSILSQLDRLPMSLPILQSCSVGLIVNKLRKKSANSAVADAAAALVKRWKKLVVVPATEAPVQETGTAEEASGKEGAASGSIGSKEGAPRCSSGKEGAAGCSNDKEGAVVVETGTKEGAATSDRSTADGATIVSASEIKGGAVGGSVGKEGASEAAIRKHCRSLLAAALAANNSLPASCWIPVHSLARDIEQEIFVLFKETNQKYRSQVGPTYFIPQAIRYRSGKKFIRHLPVLHNQSRNRRGNTGTGTGHLFLVPLFYIQYRTVPYRYQYSVPVPVPVFRFSYQTPLSMRTGTDNTLAGVYIIVQKRYLFPPPFRTSYFFLSRDIAREVKFDS